MPERQDFFAEMSLALRATTSGSSTSRVFQAGQVKVRLIEAHTAAPDPDGAERFLSHVAERQGFSLRPFAEDLSLLAGDDVLLAVDSFDPRFWQVYSTSPKQNVERALKSVLNTTT